MGDKLRERFGNSIRSLRRSRNLSQADLAERSDLSVEAVSRIERIEKLSNGLKVSYEKLFEPFEEERRDRVAALCAFLSRLSKDQLRRAHAVLRVVLGQEGADAEA